LAKNKSHKVGYLHVLKAFREVKSMSRAH